MIFVVDMLWLTQYNVYLFAIDARMGIELGEYMESNMIFAMIYSNLFAFARYCIVVNVTIYAPSIQNDLYCVDAVYV